MGRKAERRCVSMRLMVLIPVIIVLFPAAWVPSWSWSRALANSARVRLGWNESAVAELIATNGVIWTGDPAVPWASSLAVARSGRLLGVGSLADVQAAAALGTRYVDLEGRFVTPGFIDSHVHFIPGGMGLARLDLRHVRTRAGFVAAVEEAARGLREGVWISGGNWNHHAWGGALPEAAWMDGVSPRNPVWLTRMDGHMGVANSAALTAAGVDRSVTAAEGGNVVVDEEGSPTGLLREDAMKLVVRMIPAPTIQDRRDGHAAACRLALSQGITSVTDFGSFMPGAPKGLPWSDLHDVYLKADFEAQPCARVAAFLPLESWPQVAKLVEDRGNAISDWVRVGGVKAFADGSLGSATALFYEPYADEPGNRGQYVTDPEWLLEAALGADKAGLQVAVHVIGDAAVDHLLSVAEIVNSTNGFRDRRFRLEHVQHLSPGGAARVGASGVIASVQPMHLLSDANYAAKKLGEARAAGGSYAFSSLIGSGTRLALGSDWTVAPLDALSGMKAAVDRMPDGWGVPWIESESISMDAAWKGYTVDAAYASFMDDIVGSLTPGKLADFVVLSDNLLTASTQAMPKVVATYVGGVLAYSRPSS